MSMTLVSLDRREDTFECAHNCVNMEWPLESVNPLGQREHKGRGQSCLYCVLKYVPPLFMYR